MSVNTGPPEWQNTIRARLMAQQADGDALRDVIEQYQRLAKAARDLKVRNKALLRGGGGGGGDGAPLLSHLDAQLNTMRTEVSTLYRTQAAAQNKQLAMADALRDRDEEVRGLREEVRELREARDGGVRRERNWEERWRMRDEDVKTLHDEILSMQIEVSGLSQRNVSLQADNASLLQRWLDKMNLAADEMNADFEREEKASSREGVGDLASSRSEGGTGERGEKDGDKTTKDEKDGQGQEHEKETPIPTRRAATPHLEGDTLTADWEVLETGSGRSALDDDDWAEARLQTEG